MANALSPTDLLPSLKRCGYAGDNLCSNYPYGEGDIAPLVAFAQRPHDARSACLAVAPSGDDPEQQVAAFRALGAPVVMLLDGWGLHWWKPGLTRNERITGCPTAEVPGFFEKEMARLAPQALFRAKNFGSHRRAYQQDFVDVGLLPFAEAEMGRKLTDLFEHVLKGALRSLGIRPNEEPSPELFEWLFKALFHLVAGKALRDKEVPGFEYIDFAAPGDVIASVQSHYGLEQHLHDVSSARQEALEEMGARIGKISSLKNLTTESLGHIYEHALVTAETRRRLGTHSTPPFLIDYIVWSLVDWIEEIPESRRHVFEPCCGHAGFLIAAMRMLRDLRGAQHGGEDEHDYLKGRLHGLDTDPFALEIARLGLTLADVPNPNGWDLATGDFFRSDWPVGKSTSPDVLLMNPPFEKFTDDERADYGQLAFNSRAVEVFSRTVGALAPGGVFGVVMPEGVLHSRNASPLRERLCSEFELREITILGDKVFRLADAESAILLGRRRTPTGGHVVVGRVDNWRVEDFRNRQSLSDVQECSQYRLAGQPGCELRIPRLDGVWQALEDRLPKLGSSVVGGKGFEYLGAGKLPPGSKTICNCEFSGAVRGFTTFGRHTPLHGLPTERWVSLDDEVIGARRWGTVIGTPQVLLNYAPVGRGPWRLKALCDPKGHAVTSRFIALRPRDASLSLEYLWALLNSPVANAYAFCHLGKRDNLVGKIFEMPVPKATRHDIARVAEAATQYMHAARESDRHGEKLLELLLEVDASVLRLYGLSPRLERQLLDLFNGSRRPGVPFKFDRYFPQDFQPCIPLHTYISDDYKRLTSAEHRLSFRPIDDAVVSAALEEAVEAFTPDNGEDD